MFLDHKTLYYDVEPFLFYILTELHADGFNIVGYFSKEKRCASNFNLSCILVLPVHQRKGYGHFLIDFSYLLSRKEGIIRSPEKPLSDLGLLSYRTYWKFTILKALKNLTVSKISIQELSEITYMTIEDVASTLWNLGILVKNKNEEYSMNLNMESVDRELDKLKKKKYPKIDPKLLQWTRNEKKPGH